ncbi:MAG: hypothetical protein KAT79_01810 [candidate division Zixibacteria bacterium]|nr:hypothetical protein [candidate division Zixibacteria bacterium]
MTIHWDHFMPLVNNHSRVIGVYDETCQYLEAHKDVRMVIADHFCAYDSIGALYPQTKESFASGHTFPHAESVFELENSLEFALLGFYRHAFYALRCTLELGSLGMFFDRQDKAHIEIQPWLRSEEKTPFFTSFILPRLFELDRMKYFDQVHGLQASLKELYTRKLSKYVHVAGFGYSAQAFSKANFNRMSERGIRLYQHYLQKVVSSLTKLLLLKYPIGIEPLPMDSKFGLFPPIGGFLDEHSHEIVMKVLDEESKRTLETISSRDPDVQEIVQDIRSRPNLTPEQIQEQSKLFEELKRDISS